MRCPMVIPCCSPRRTSSRARACTRRFRSTRYATSLPISQLTLSPNVWIVHPAFAARSMKDLIEIARSKPGAIDFGSSGSASTQHLAGELLNLMTGIHLVHIPYKGGGPALIDLMSGRIQVMSSTVPSAVPHIKTGRVRALAVTSLQRSSALPEVPTVAEAAGPSRL